MQVNNYISKANLRPFPGLLFPTQGLSTPKTSAVEWRSMMLVVGPALLKFERFDPLVPCIGGKFKTKLVMHVLLFYFF